MGTGCLAELAGFAAAAALRLGYSCGLRLLDRGGAVDETGKGVGGVQDGTPELDGADAQLEPAVRLGACSWPASSFWSGFCQPPPPPDGTSWVLGSLPAFSCGTVKASSAAPAASRPVNHLIVMPIESSHCATCGSASLGELGCRSFSDAESAALYLPQRREVDWFRDGKFLLR